MSKFAPAAARLTDVVVLAVVCLFQFVFVAGLPVFDNGLWPQTENPTTALHFLSALLFLGTGLQIALKDGKYIRALTSPVVVALFAFAVFSALVAPFSDSPARSVQGTLKHGVGVVWQFEFAMATLAAVALWQDACLRRIAIWSAGLAAFAVSALYAFEGSGAPVPLAFAEWSGMLALAAAGAVVLSGQALAGDASGEAQGPSVAATVAFLNGTPSSDAVLAAQSASARYRRRRSTVSAFRWAAAAALAAFGLWASDNRTVVLVVAVLAAYWLVGRVPVIGALYRKPVLRAATVVLIALAGTAASYFAAPVIEARALRHAPPASASTILSDDPLDKLALHDGAIGTIWSRSYMVRILAEDLMEHPSKLLTGNGFGYFATAYEYHAREVPGRRYPDANPTASNTYWDVHDKANFHSHNMLAETVTSVGLFGALIWLAVFAAMAWSSGRGALVALGIVVMGNFWFPINHMMGAMALLTAATASVGAPRLRTVNLLSGLGSLFAVFGLAFFGFLGLSTLSLGMVEHSERYFTPVEVNSDPEKCGFIRSNYFPENEIVIDLYSILRKRIADASSPSVELNERTTNLISTNCMLRRYYTDGNDIRSLVASLEGRTPLVAMGPVSYGPLNKDIVKWGDDLAELLKLAPERTEYLPPYLAILAQRAPAKAATEIDRFLPLTADGDPVHEFLLSLKAKAAGDQTGYAAHFRKAVDLGYANLWKVSPASVSETGAK